MSKLMAVPGVDLISADQCQFGAEVTSGHKAGCPIKKPTGFLSNSPCILEELNKRCAGRGGNCSRRKGGVHARCEGRIAKQAAKYSRGLCRAILKGAHRQMKTDGHLQDGCIGLMPGEDKVCDILRGPAQGYSGKYRDDISGQVLRDDLIGEARKLELAYFAQKGVWQKRPHGESRKVTGKPPITVRWVDTNKGDDMVPKYRSRLVARQIKAMDNTGGNYFAPAPPIEALRAVLSMTATTIGEYKPDWSPTSERRTQLSLIDVSRAYFNAHCDPSEPCYVELPPEDADNGVQCGLLLRHMYGTRRAADGWQEEYSTLLVQELGFRQGVSCPNIFFNSERGIRCSVHGDDFTSSGPKPELDWMEREIAERYEITMQPRMGPGPDDAKEGLILNRVVRWCESHLEYEADPRQVERLVDDRWNIRGWRPARGGIAELGIR